MIYTELKPGTLLLEKRYNIIKRLVYKLLKKELQYNRMTITSGNIMCTNSGVFYEPKKEYSKVEISKLNILLDDASLSVVDIINMIRPKTITNTVWFRIDDITKNKYYKLVDGEETKHIPAVSKGV